VIAYHLDSGVIRGVDVSGLTVASVVFIPGNVLAGNWKAAVYLDDRVTPGQEQALLAVCTGRKGGPVADLAKLVGEVVSVEKVPIAFEVHGGRGTIRIGTAGFAELEPYKSATGATMTLADTIFSTVPGAPVFVGKSPHCRAHNAKLGIDVDLKGRNALQSTFVFSS
jgi:hypothetical protein